MNTVAEPRSNTSEELIILVHGTYAGDGSDAGDKWWQEGSEVAAELQRKLPDNVRVAAGSEVFHWSGENGERARSKAARKLLAHLQPLDDSGRAYHLVGHSHGGSVIWNAMRMATLAKKPLQGLRSWTTVGTPFLHQTSPSPWNLWNLARVLFALALIRPVFNTVGRMTELLWNAASGNKVTFIAMSDEDAGYVAVLRAPFIALGERLGLPVERTDEGILLAMFDPSEGISLLEYLFMTREGVIFLFLVLTFVYIFLHLAIMCVRPVMESIRAYAEKRLRIRAFSRYGHLWLGLWSPDDEAINGLRATLSLSASFVKRIAPTDRVFLTDNLALLSRPYYWVLAPFFNTICRPVANVMLSGIIARSAQGNDHPTARVVAVLPAPVLEANEAPPLPEPIQKKILQEADRNTGAVAPKLRQLLGCPSITSGLESFGSELSGRELVHTSYFDHAEVLELIAYNVVSPSVEQIDSHVAAERNRSLIEWFHDFKAIVTTGEPDSLLLPDGRVTHPSPAQDQSAKAA